ncbi:protein boule isoform X2 [Scaptodrosophila lebanonensis]|uniref:Protein boule isoform X2 n=1 Tax=Drosophila lebanonensis TaxID=7225 RepID=A0A6J2TZ04_DROLE|nr:protein boule isoform X2 [Scaptodrosophila lebanonensis]
MHKITAAPATATAPAGTLEAPLTAPKYGTLIPNRIFVGGISGDTTEADLTRVFSAYGTVKSTKIIVDRAGVSKGYGFVTFETEQEAQRLQADGECVVLRDRKLNIAPAIKKQPNPLQSIVATNGAVYYTTTPPAPISNIPMDQFAAAVYPPAAGVPAIYPPSAMQYQPFYQYYSVPMQSPFAISQNVPTIWPQNYQENAQAASITTAAGMPPLTPSIQQESSTKWPNKYKTYNPEQSRKWRKSP